ncbi:acetylornithine deacetylase [Jatrophihabitans endophyticus]|uniref:Acetylornithine deacetylase n=1 Tax=Jatrophihabitans endophyticus TaxID=1206085 RepID=A0A1M5CQV0_9ACTN|nr:M20/M25/M40 family metallo-hydrolase [Jatrophihabitans endophyticus]SHF57131.1 acetylornithine deacetylase [Jatrophihabitans endophyticus]
MTPRRADVPRADPVDDAYAAALLKSMVAIPSPSFGEAALALHLLAETRAQGFTSHLDAMGNLVAVTGRGDGPTIMLLGHMDTVAGSPPVRMSDRCLWGRGSVDAKGALAAFLCTARGLQDLPARIVVVGAVEEETPGSRGAVHVRDTMPPPDYLVVGEPSGWSSVVLGYKGKLDLTYRVTTPATHSSNPAAKAGELAAEFWFVLRELLGPDSSHTRFDRPGGTLLSLEATMTHARADICVRTPPGFDVPALLLELERRCPEGTVTVRNQVAAHRVNRTGPVATALSRAIIDHGGTPRARVKTATSDLNTVAVRWQLPMAVYGPGDSALDHSDDEHIELDDYFRSIAVLHDALTALATAPRPTSASLAALTDSTG